MLSVVQSFQIQYHTNGSAAFGGFKRRRFGPDWGTQYTVFSISHSGFAHSSFSFPCRDFLKFGGVCLSVINHSRIYQLTDFAFYNILLSCLSIWAIDLQSLFGLHVHCCTYWLGHRNPPPPPSPHIWAPIQGRYWSAKKHPLQYELNRNRKLFKITILRNLFLVLWKRKITSLIRDLKPRKRGFSLSESRRRFRAGDWGGGGRKGGGGKKGGDYPERNTPRNRKDCQEIKTSFEKFFREYWKNQEKGLEMAVQC